MPAKAIDPPQLMRLDYSKLFKLLDGYAKRHHKCFVAELSFDDDKGEYTVCFRPSGASPESPDRYACGYLTIDADEARQMLRAGLLTVSVADTLEEELCPLSLME